MEAFIEASNNNFEYFLNQPLFLDMKEEEGNSLLHYAIRGGADDVSLYLLKNHINVNITNLDGETAIFDAIRKGNKEIIVKIITNFGKVNLKNIKGETPLHIAASKGRLDIIKLLIENKAIITEENNLGESVLFYAILSGDLNIFKYLSKLSPKFSKVSKNKNTLLHVSAKQGNLKTVKYLLGINENPHLKNNLGETPLFLAVKEGFNDLIGVFAKAGAYLDVTNKYKESLFDLVSVIDYSTLKETITFYLESSINSKNIKKHPLRYAVITNNYELLEKQLLSGIKDFKDEYNLTALDYAKKENNKKIIKLLTT